MPIINKVNLERTDFGYQWSDSAQGAAIKLTGRSADGSRSSPWPLHRPGSATVTPRQVHSRSVKHVPPLPLVAPADAIVTTQPDITLLVVTADCVPILAFDGRTAVAVHAGWRGIAASIVSRALSKLSSDESWQLWIGPHIGGCCYEVGEEVAAQVAAASDDGSVLADNGGGRPHLDLLHAVLVQARLRPQDHVTVVEQCTRCSEEVLWSYRRDGAATGSNLAGITIGSR